jgi:copper chaperone CopZ
MDHLTLHIDGMSCGHCVSAVRGALERVPGVEVRQVEIGTATVAFDPTKTSTSEIVEAVNDEGYSAYAASAA